VAHRGSHGIVLLLGLQSCALQLSFRLNHRYYDQDLQPGQLHGNPRFRFDAITFCLSSRSINPYTLATGYVCRPLNRQRRTIRWRDAIIVHLRNN